MSYGAGGEVTFQQLRYLVALVDHGHFGRAADACHVSQPTLSTQVRRLEARLGVPLIDRASTPLAPTPLGARIARHARGLLAGRTEILELARQESAELKGTLRLGAIPTIAPYLLPALALRARRDWPEVVLEVIERPTHDLTQRLRRGELDAAFVATDERDPAWTTHVLGSEPFVCYLAPGHPLLARARLDAAALPRDELWLLTDGHCFREQVLAACGADGAGRVAGMRFESGALSTLQRMVDTSGGLTLLPSMALTAVPSAARARVRPFTDPAPGRTIRTLGLRASSKVRLVREITTQAHAAWQAI